MIGTRTGSTVGTLAVLALLAAGCGADEPTVDATAAVQEPATTATAPQDGTENAGEEEAAAVEGTATLEERSGTGVSGGSTLRWDPDTEVLSVDVEVEGLEEGVTYLAVIAAGCQPPTQRIHQLGSIAGGPDGTGQVTAEVDDVASVDLDGGWVVLVGRPQAGPQACGEVGPA